MGTGTYGCSKTELVALNLKEMSLHTVRAAMLARFVVFWISIGRAG